MKFQPKRFVVEVKRGTNRAAFASPDASADKFSSAEAMLFGGASKRESATAQPMIAREEAVSGRILRSLVEPPPPIIEDLPAPARRGRKPGSKNKPKFHLAAPEAVEGSEVPAERPRRGRKPGSKNRPKAEVPTGIPRAIAAGHDSLAAAMRSYGFADDGTVWHEPATSPTPEPIRAPAASVPTAAAAAAEDGVRRAGRLRDRSSILKRYVLDLEPRPGQPGALRARRLARAAR